MSGFPQTPTLLCNPGVKAFHPVWCGAAATQATRTELSHSPCFLLLAHGAGKQGAQNTEARGVMSYPTMENTRWERKPQAMVLAPRKSIILRGDDDDLPRDTKMGMRRRRKIREKPLGEWHQVRRGHEELEPRTAWLLLRHCSFDCSANDR